MDPNQVGFGGGLDEDYETDRWGVEYDDNKVDFRFKGYWLIEDITRDKDFEELHFKVGTEDYGAFMSKLLQNIKTNRRFGWFRILIDDYGFSFLMRKFNLYINGVHNGTNLYEIRILEEECNFFQTRFFTGYGPDYGSLLGGKRGRDNLKGLQLGFKTLLRHAERVSNNPDGPEHWGQSIAVFAMTFSEPGRFRWSKEDLTVIMKEHRDITLAGPFEYMAVLPKDWKPICEAARLATIRKQKLSKEEEENLETRTVKACKKLKYNGAHARAALNIGTLNRLRYSIYGDDDGLGDGDDDGLGDGDGRGRDMKYGSHDVGRRGPHLEIRERRETHTKTKANSPRQRYSPSPEYGAPSRSRPRSRSRGRPASRSRSRSRGRYSPSPEYGAPSRSRPRSRSRGRPASRSRSRSRGRYSPSPEYGAPSRSRPRSRSRGRPASRSRCRSRGREEGVGNTLYVSGLSKRCTKEQLEKHVSKAGKVANCSLVLDPHSGISRGFAFVTMETLEDANRCIKNLNQSVLDRRQITVEMVRRKRVSTNTRDTGYRGDCGDRGGDRGRGSGRDDYGYWKSQRRSPPQGGRDYFPPPRRSPSPYRGRGRDYSPPRH